MAGGHLMSDNNKTAPTALTDRDLENVRGGTAASENPFLFMGGVDQAGMELFSQIAQEQRLGAMEERAEQRQLADEAAQNQGSQIQTASTSTQPRPTRSHRIEPGTCLLRRRSKSVASFSRPVMAGSRASRISFPTGTGTALFLLPLPFRDEGAISRPRAL